jgi:phosphohistidine phosphatase
VLIKGIKKPLTLIVITNYMKYLFLVRHAKSSWDFPELPDFDRPLNKRGKSDAPEMGLRLASRKLELDAIISSPANRAITTARLIADQLDFSNDDISENEDVYHSGYTNMVEIIHELSDDLKSVMLVGHNPGFTDLSNYLKEPDYFIDNVPTCGVVAIEFALNRWSDVSKHGGRMLFFDYPKKVL